MSAPDEDQPGAHPGGMLEDFARWRLLDRRRALGLMGIAGGGLMLSTRTGTAPAAAQGSCPAFAWETDGPFPADGTNRAPGPTSNVLTMEAFRRQDIRPSLIGSDTVASGVPVELVLTLVDAAGCAPLPGHVIYLWHNDAAGHYSLYDLPGESYLRGIQQTDEAGRVRFMTTFPGCYGGRYPHMHFQVFGSMDSAASGRQTLLTSQLALPAAECASVYRDAETYGRSIANLERSSLTRDFIFRDNPPSQMEAMILAMRGSPAEGYTATATVAILRESL